MSNHVVIIVTASIWFNSKGGELMQDEDVCKERDWLATQALFIVNILIARVCFLLYLLFASPHFASLWKSLQKKIDSWIFYTFLLRVLFKQL